LASISFPCNVAWGGADRDSLDGSSGLRSHAHDWHREATTECESSTVARTSQWLNPFARPIGNVPSRAGPAAAGSLARRLRRWAGGGAPWVERLACPAAATPSEQGLTPSGELTGRARQRYTRDTEVPESASPTLHKASSSLRQGARSSGDEAWVIMPRSISAQHERARS
jgi:hypothetical protein